MPLESIFAFLMIVAIVILWWFARKDLNARAAEKHAPTVVELSALRATIEDLIDVMEERASEVEHRLSAVINEARDVQASLKEAVVVSKTNRDLGHKPDLMLVSTEPDISIKRQTTDSSIEVDSSVIQAEMLGESEPDPYSSVYALSDDGIEDSAEIARRTGLGRAEVEMVLQLRDRRE